ncbi:MAG: Rrf2 family transcriptional regulator [Proteobacteria bacterium]|nr:Rrf2 family transcriptional regulator [Pseudomonadota bacterium]
MKLSTRCRYGIRAVLEIATNFGKHPTKRRVIAHNQNLDDSYLENILIDLKKNDIVLAIRGAKGGFMLKRSPETISVLDVIESLEGKLSPVECLLTPLVCERVEKCLTRPVWLKLKEAQENVLKNITIRDILDQGTDDSALNFNI